ncbi:hypothetical protein EVAR_85905_1 [Eumeta japonica]|uniref:Reverse transcriptase domain-containing protein n=1 Tax=Eumeta variegata TaxID=151549 RepID=A0A4C2A6Q8_EUMVA|nr:hypothetical protein EVAR_85905_1 [Eumeta japonica]
MLPSLSPKQYGFMPQRSTEDALYDLVNHVKKEIESKKRLTDAKVHCQAFADDVVLAFSSESSSTIENAANEAMKIVTKWGSENKLNFAPQNTSYGANEKLKFQTPPYRWRPQINLVEEIKRNNKDHIHSSDRTHHDVRIEHMGPATELEMIRSALSSLQRGFAIKICRAYRTVSLTSAMILQAYFHWTSEYGKRRRCTKQKGLSMDYLPPKELEKDIANTERPHPAKAMSIEYELIDESDPDP